MLIASLLPIYIFGNLHCMGMCGPLVMMLGRHRYRYFYFLGRTLSFTLVGALSGGLGSVFNVILQEYHLSALACFAVGLFIPFAQFVPVPAWAAGPSRSLSHLMLRDTPLATFLFGLFTVALPCGQTLIVYSACAIYGDPWIGLFNGFIFALLTSPALFLSMQMHRLLKFTNYNVLFQGSSLIVAALAICRGLAELGLIPHLVLNPSYHIILY